MRPRPAPACRRCCSFAWGYWHLRYARWLRWMERLAEYMRVHALEATGGYTYAQMGQFEAKPGTPKSQLEPGGGTSNEKFAAIDPKTGGPAANGERTVWINETALATALNTSYMADQISLFGIVVGIALLLSGIGFIVLAFVVLPRRREAPAS